MGTNIIITQPNGNRVPMQNRRTATGITSAKQNCGLNAEDTVDITIESPYPQEYNIGDKITVFGRDYKLNRLPSVKKTGTHHFQYNLQFEGVQYDLIRVTYDLTIDTTTNELQDVQGDALTGNLHRFMTVLIANANRVFPGKWKLGACPDTIGDKTLTFGECDNCLSVLQNLCSESNFDVEFEIEQAEGVYTINLYERIGQTLPFVFEYGRGRGLYELHRDNVSSANIVTRLKVYGSTENITFRYRADRLCLPGKSKGQSYIEKPEIVAKYGLFEGRKNFDDIKPTYTGSVESKVDEYSFTDSKFPFDINAKNEAGDSLYLGNGESAKIHFNTGNLAGFEFEVSYNHAEHKFKLKKTKDERGDELPSIKSKAFQFTVGDEYKVLDIAYSSDIEAKAESQLAETANKYYDQNCQPKVQYGLSVTKSYLENLVGSPDALSHVFVPGDYVRVVDKDIEVDKAVRIQAFTRNILDPYDYSLTLSDSVTDASITNRVISELVELDKIVTINHLKDPVRARANWQTSREVLDMVFDAEGDYYSEKIKPNSIDTQMLAVGAKSMQFGLTNTMFQPNYNGNPNVVKWVGGVLTHYAIKGDTTSSWTMANGEVSLTNDSAMYVYAKCEKMGTAGAFVFTSEQIIVDADANYYHFLVGTLSSVDVDINARTLALTYGFTTINGRFIRTGRIESADCTTYFDLDNAEIGGRIVFESADGSRKTLEELGLDNTQTTIDGGIVTSGTIEVAGDKSNVLAGITGQGTTPDSVRFWAGVPFERRHQAPYRVLQNGTAIISNAHVEGEVFAFQGNIGGFDFAAYRIGTKKSGYDFSITDEYIAYNKHQDTSEKDKKYHIFTGIGVNTTGSSPQRALSRLQYLETQGYNPQYSNGVALFVQYRPLNPSYSQKQFALAYDGNVYGVGSRAIFEDTYIGPAYSNTIQQNLHRAHTFVFTSIPTSGVNILLPTKEDITKALAFHTANNEVTKVNVDTVTFVLYIQVNKLFNGNYIHLSASKDVYLVDNNGNPLNKDYYGFANLSQDDVIMMRYCQGNYQIILYHT